MRDAVFIWPWRLVGYLKEGFQRPVALILWRSCKFGGIAAEIEEEGDARSVTGLWGAMKFQGLIEIFLKVM